MLSDLGLHAGDQLDHGVDGVEVLGQQVIGGDVHVELVVQLGDDGHDVEGGLSFVNDQQSIHIPTKAQEVFDVSGAGDTVIAVFAMALAGGLNPVAGAYMANLAASVVVAKLGTYAVSREELLDVLK